MNSLRITTIAILLMFVSVGAAFAQMTTKLGDNAALRYWSAFAQMQDSALTDQQVKELRGILDGPIPYDDSKYKDLVERNKAALETMIRATAIPSCEWGVDYQLGPDAPVDYVRKALALGRLNVLYAFHLGIARDPEGAARALAAGLRFSHDVANGGTLFATLIAKDLLTGHLRAVAGALRLEQLSAGQRSQLQTAVARVGEGLDWPMAAKRDLEALRGDYAGNSQTSAALTRIISSYVAALNDESRLPALDQAVQGAPQELANVIPNAKRVLEQKQDLNNTLLQTRALLQ